MSALDGLAAGDLHRLPSAELLDRVAELVRARNRIDAELARTVRRAELAQAPEHDGLKTMASAPTVERRRPALFPGSPALRPSSPAPAPVGRSGRHRTHRPVRRAAACWPCPPSAPSWPPTSETARTPLRARRRSARPAHATRQSDP